MSPDVEEEEIPALPARRSERRPHRHARRRKKDRCIIL